MNVRTGLFNFIALMILLHGGTSLAADAEEYQPKGVSTPYPTVGRVERADSAMDAIVPPEAKLELLAEGFVWSEGPVWVDEGKYLLFSDIPPNRIYQWSAEEGLKLYLTPSGYTDDKPRGGEVGSNGLLLDLQGRLVLCQHGTVGSRVWMPH